MGEVIANIIIGVLGLGTLGVGIAKLIDEANKSSDAHDEEAEDEDTEDSYIATDTDLSSDNDDGAYYANDIVSNNDENFEESADSFSNDIDTALADMNADGNAYGPEYLYIDFVSNLNTLRRNFDDAYQEPLSVQYEKIQRKLSTQGKMCSMDLQKFVKLCFPPIKSTYFISMPGFNRVIEEHTTTQPNLSVLRNIVIRVGNSITLSSVIPDSLELVIVGDLTFRKNLIYVVVKGIDLVDRNVKKFGELKIECSAACATSWNEKHLPDFGLIGRDLYRSFLTRDKVLSLCKNVYPIEHPKIAIRKLEEWKEYVNFRKYYLQVQSSRCEEVNSVSFITGYSVSRLEYRHNEEEYSSHILDGFKSFTQKDQVLLDESVDGAMEIPLIKIVISKNKSEIDQQIAKGKNISNYERALRSFTRNPVALSMSAPDRSGQDTQYDSIMYLGDRMLFEYKDIKPDTNGITEKYKKKLERNISEIDDKFAALIHAAIEEYRLKTDSELTAEINKGIEEYCAILDSRLEDDANNNSDKEIKEKYLAEKAIITAKYNKLRNQAAKNPATDKNALEAKLHSIEKEEAEKISDIPLRQWYIDRNTVLKKHFSDSKRKYKSDKLDSQCREKERLLNIELADPIEKEKQTVQRKLTEEMNNEINKLTQSKTVRRFYIYFKADDLPSEQTKPEALQQYKYLRCDDRAEKKKVERQQKAISAFYRGYVKNPFISSYLFEPESLGEPETKIDNVEWYSNRLNDTQMEAVKRALSSNSIFLLQGPPGTGKTEVIAEITAQYVKQGKKVLISSETHKAIDNVFERLPKIPEIRPLRLIPSTSNKDSEYSPEKLVDNLYLSISARLDKRIRQYENFSDMKENFSSKMSKLKFDHKRAVEAGQKCRNLQIDKDNIQKRTAELDFQVEDKRKFVRPLLEEKEQYNFILTCMDRRSFEERPEKAEPLAEICQYIFDLVSTYELFSDVDLQKAIGIANLDIEKVRGEFQTIEKNNGSMSVQQEKASIKSQMKALKDECDDILEGREAEYKELQGRLRALVNSETPGTFDLSGFSTAKFISADLLSSSINRASALQTIIEVQSMINDFISQKRAEIEALVGRLSSSISLVENEINDLNIKKNQLTAKAEQLNSDETYIEYRQTLQELRKSITDFFLDFDIHEEYPADDFDAAIGIISKKWEKICTDQMVMEKENKAKIPMFKAINEYLSKEDILENDRISYTKKLFDNANVFGMTCTSRDYYSESSMKSLREYNLGNISVKNVGIDVVIIDEVSKSSFLELLIPMLYGKTVILVGDHRQLPPMYDLKHLRPKDFDCLDPAVIDYDRNKNYQKLYETCFFKELFERVPDGYRIMLDRQYRCHSDIMEVFNHFYDSNGSGLKIGLTNQNDLKQHFLTVRTNGMTIIEPQNHVYFVNCTEYESKYESESSSIINREEADVVCRLLELINDEYGRMINSGTIKVNSKRDERKSIGVICTYRDQAKYIKSKLKGVKFSNISQKRDEKLIINTVDDFQGDERDIIIVSMVRNPQSHNYNTEFIDQFERINVALSRARCMLVIVGSQDFLSQSRIDLPDINGRKELDRHSYPIYKEVIRTIQAKGKLLQASDVIGEVKLNGK